MFNIYNEIRTASTNRFRYFVNMKLSKLLKDIKNPLPLSDTLSLLDTDTCHLYWKTVHQIYVLLESEQENKNEPYINTLISEIDRRDLEKSLREEEVIERGKRLAENAEKRLSIQQERASIPSIDDFINQIESNPEMMEAVSMMLGKSLSINDMKTSLKQAMKENPQIMNMIKGAMSMASNSSSENVDLLNIVNQFVPDLDMNCHTNIVLVNKIFNDMMYIFEGNMVKERMKEKIIIYKDLLTNNRITISEMLACIWTIANDKDKINSIQNISTENLTVDMFISLALELIPEDMIGKLGDIKALKAMFADGDMGGLGDLLKQFKGQMQPDIEQNLTDEQLKELEDFYNENF
jgi:hypothetical protein